MTVTQLNEIQLIIDSLNETLKDVEAGDKVSLSGLREEEALLIKELLAKHIAEEE